MPPAVLQFSEESSDSTTELVEEALIELHSEGKQADLPAIFEHILPPRTLAQQKLFGAYSFGENVKMSRSALSE